jgi:hypothetical protein
MSREIAKSLRRQNRNQQRRVDALRTVSSNTQHFSNRGGFPGVAKIGTSQITGLTSDATKPWVMCDLGAETATEQIGPEPVPMPDGQVWIKKSEQHGPIIIVRD